MSRLPPLHRLGAPTGPPAGEEVETDDGTGPLREIVEEIWRDSMSARRCRRAGRRCAGQDDEVPDGSDGLVLPNDKYFNTVYCQDPMFWLLLCERFGWSPQADPRPLYKTYRARDATPPPHWHMNPHNRTLFVLDKTDNRAAVDLYYQTRAADVRQQMRSGLPQRIDWREVYRQGCIGVQRKDPILSDEGFALLMEKGSHAFERDASEQRTDPYVSTLFTSWSMPWPKTPRLVFREYREYDESIYRESLVDKLFYPRDFEAEKRTREMLPPPDDEDLLDGYPPDVGFFAYDNWYAGSIDPGTRTRQGWGVQCQREVYNNFEIYVGLFRDGARVYGNTYSVSARTMQRLRRPDEPTDLLFVEDESRWREMAAEEDRRRVHRSRRLFIDYDDDDLYS